MADNIPSADPAFDAWQRGLVTYVTTQVDTHVAELRRKLEADPARPQHILTVRKVGYRFAAE